MEGNPHRTCVSAPGSSLEAQPPACESFDKREKSIPYPSFISLFAQSLAACALYYHTQYYKKAQEKFCKLWQL
jgi:hypothetical protein